MTAPTVLRTPDERFAGLPGFPFPPSYAEDLSGFEGLRMHYLDLGPRRAERTFLCLHGEPTWSYLYRKMVPTLLETGARVVAPDFLGFGRSDKPTDPAAYSFSFHRNSILRLVELLELARITLVVQDWGGTIGLTLPVDPDFRSRLERLVIMNTVLPAGRPLGEHYNEWRALVRRTPELPVGEWMRQAAPGLTEAEMAAYDAPFPDVRFQAGAKIFPELAMVDPGMDGVSEALAAQEFWAHDWSGPSFMVIGANDPDAGEMPKLHSGIRGCPVPLTLNDAGHFVPENGSAAAEAALRAFGGL